MLETAAKTTTPRQMQIRLRVSFYFKLRNKSVKLMYFLHGAMKSRLVFISARAVQLWKAANFLIVLQGKKPNYSLKSFFKPWQSMGIPILLNF